MARKVYDVIKVQSDWKGIVRGGEKASVVAKTKQEAVSKTISIAKNKDLSQVVIRDKTGKIQSERTYGNDPRTSKG